MTITKRSLIIPGYPFRLGQPYIPTGVESPSSAAIEVLRIYCSGCMRYELAKRDALTRV